MTTNSEEWEADFPMREHVEDPSGRMRSFVITCHEGPIGYTVRAEEQGRDGPGYEFGAFSETSPSSALGRLRQKMRRALATRHITETAGTYRMLHDLIRGRIAWDGHDGVVLVVDGVALSIEDLESILATHEGFELELRIVDSLE